ncbi:MULTISPECIES: TIR domain-containing protein [Bacillus subtilis group]|uniref:TIR domain-containing protein n=1 Tax=Bacillus subtilis group TaxID=653685 RepID=UPI002DB8BB32|nr:TIR domain-containing protein [Bacillus inaquosorum]MEC2062693.1 TIR domain-containing protein [Bacillus inaquosorum]MEC2086164.1 TIR domain-containing protein [Bacillus inaquosorum]
MAHKTFISYKYSEAKNLRDRIVDSLGEDAKYYQGETSESPNMSDRTTEYIKSKLKNMIYSTSVTIVIISPNMKKSKWIDWEIEFSLKQIKRSERRSGTNGIVGVVMKHNGDYSWLRPEKTYSDGHTAIMTKNEYLYEIITRNRFNQNPKEYSCDVCKTIDQLTGSYISLIAEEDFLRNPDRYIENAYEKSKNVDNYELCRQK